jgi:Protein of unknown function with HXXEE motif
MPTAFVWLPVAAVTAHLCEEFIWPGGFASWYRGYPPGHSATVSVRFLVLINALFVGLALLPVVLGPTTEGYAYWVLVAAIAGANGVFHLAATVRTRAYSPGVVTGVALYLPLAVGGTAHLLRLYLVAPGTVFQAVLIAAVYSAWSSWRHRRHATVRTAS